MFENQGTHSKATINTMKTELQNNFNQNKATASPDDSSHVAPTTGRLITRSGANNLSAINVQFRQIRQLSANAK